MNALPEAADTEMPVLAEYPSDGVALITLNRPAKRNAMNRAARAALIDALDDCRGHAKVIVLTGSGPAFCSGVDLKEVAAAAELSADTAAERRTAWRAVQEEIKKHPAVVIAAVNGTALGGGVTLLNAADLALAAEDAQLGMPEVGFGAYPGLAGPSTQLRTSMKRAAWLVLTAERIDGRTAEAWGLVNRAVPGDRLLDEALALAERLAGFDAVALEWCKKALWEVPARLTDWAAALERWSRG